MMDKSRAFLRTLGLPGGDLHSLPTSEATFPGGAQFGVEIPTVNTFAAAKALLRETQRLGVTVNRIDETLGAFRHTRAELLEYAALCRDSGAALTVSIGPRAAYDTSATRLSRQGAVIGYRLRGEEQLVRALEDAKRVCDLGIRGLLVYDEGLLWVLSEARKTGELPADTVLKASAHCGHGNGASFRLLEQEGVGGIVFSPLAQGLLTNRYLDGIPQDSRVARNGFLKKEALTPELLAKIGKLNGIASGRGQTLAEMAIAWLLARPGVTSALIGASRPAQIRDVVAGLSGAPLTPAELARIDAILA